MEKAFDELEEDLEQIEVDSVIEDESETLDELEKAMDELEDENVASPDTTQNDVE